MEERIYKKDLWEGGCYGKGMKGVVMEWKKKGLLEICKTGGLTRMWQKENGDFIDFFGKTPTVSIHQRGI